jgi:hypothetical protein
MCDAAEISIATSSADEQNPESQSVVYKQLKNALANDISNPHQRFPSTNPEPTPPPS